MESHSTLLVSFSRPHFAAGPHSAKPHTCFFPTSTSFFNPLSSHRPPRCHTDPPIRLSDLPTSQNHPPSHRWRWQTPSQTSLTSPRTIWPPNPVHAPSEQRGEERHAALSVGLDGEDGCMLNSDVNFTLCGSPAVCRAAGGAVSGPGAVCGALALCCVGLWRCAVSGRGAASRSA